MVRVGPTSTLRQPPLLVRHHPMRPSLLYPASPSTTSSLIPSLSLSLSLTPSPPPRISFRLSPSHLWHDVSPFRRSILLSSSAPRLVWMPTERYHIKFRALCSEHLKKLRHIAKVFSREYSPWVGDIICISPPRRRSRRERFYAHTWLLSIFFRSRGECKFLFDAFSLSSPEKSCLPWKSAKENFCLAQVHELDQLKQILKEASYRMYSFETRKM